MDKNLRIFSLFVCGTLKKGYYNHNRLCRNVKSIETAYTYGKLFHLPAGFPALEIPKNRILAEGTYDPEYDAELQNRFNLHDKIFNKPDNSTKVYIV